MVKRFLITTALEETWRDDEQVLFLGEWCRRYSRRERWARMQAEVLPYHWDDRAKLYADYQSLRTLYERLLVDLSGQLNHIHGVERTLRYWRILIGPWLGYFTQILFDRWTSIQDAVEQHELSGSIVLSGEEEALVPNGMADFVRVIARDEWNHHLYALILERYTGIHCTRQARPAPAGQVPTGHAAAAGKRQVRRVLRACADKAAGILRGDRDAFFLATYLPLREELKMHWRLGQLPQLWRSVPAARVAADMRQRQWTVPPGENRSEFEACIRALIPQQVPSVYLEGYRQLVEQTESLPWPEQPKIIWTSGSQNPDDVFKAWAARNVERGAPLVIGQHGGHFGVGLWSSFEDHDISVSDRYLSWGWSDARQPKVEPVGQLTASRPLGVRHREQPQALLVTCSFPRFSYWMYSSLVAGQWLEYFDEQCVFVEHLPPVIRDALTVRLYPDDFGWDQVARWRDRFPELRLDQGQISINELIQRSRIYISTYNATTYLQSFTMDVPTVIYWNPKHWELRDSASPYFEDLKRVGIFHETPQSAARHIAAVWNDVDEWWSSPAVREVLERFKRRFCDLPQDVTGRVEQVLREVMDESAARTVMQ